MQHTRWVDNPALLQLRWAAALRLLWHATIWEQHTGLVSYLIASFALARLDSTAAATTTAAYGLWPGQNQARTASLCWLLATDYVQLATATASATAIATLGSR